jgi:putative PIN family toxin of toxin-antitoxin system
VRVLLDTNILVRANGKSDGPARKLLLDLIARRHILLTSAEILIELARVLRYPRVLALFGLSEEQIYEYVQFLKSVCVIGPTSPRTGRSFPIRDAADAHVLGAAITGEAHLICTLDSDFYTVEITAFCAVAGITVLDDISLLDRLRFGRSKSIIIMRMPECGFDEAHYPEL